MKKFHLYALIRSYKFINFQQIVPPIRLFTPILLFFFVGKINFQDSLSFLGKARDILLQQNRLVQFCQDLAAKALILVPPTELEIF